MVEKQKIRDFYDGFSGRQQNTIHNERHFFLLERLKKAGVRPDSRILEIGCGVGSMTSLMAPLVPRGRIVATDLSPRSIELARENNRGSRNVEFFAADSGTCEFPPGPYDFVVLFDVLEHLLAPDRASLVKRLAGLMQDDTRLLVNIPAPEALAYAAKETPEQLQIVDEPIYLGELLPLLEANGLSIHSFFTYDMWQVDEYQFFVIRKKLPYVFKRTQPPAEFDPNSLPRRIGRRLRKLRPG